MNDPFGLPWKQKLFYC